MQMIKNNKFLAGLLAAIVAAVVAFLATYSNSATVVAPVADVVAPVADVVAPVADVVATETAAAETAGELVIAAPAESNSTVETK